MVLTDIPFTAFTVPAFPSRSCGKASHRFPEPLNSLVNNRFPVVKIYFVVAFSADFDVSLSIPSAVAGIAVHPPCYSRVVTQQQETSPDHMAAAADDRIAYPRRSESS